MREGKRAFQVEECVAQAMTHTWFDKCCPVAHVLTHHTSKPRVIDFAKGSQCQRQLQLQLQLTVTLKLKLNFYVSLLVFFEKDILRQISIWTAWLTTPSTSQVYNMMCQVSAATVCAFLWESKFCVIALERGHSWPDLWLHITSSIFTYSEYIDNWTHISPNLESLFATGSDLLPE